MAKSIRNVIASVAISASAGFLGMARQASAAPVPIATTGWNRDVVIENQGTSAVQTLGQGAFAYLETNSLTTSGGLPAETAGNPVNWNSLLTNSVTGGNTQFQFQPYGTAGGGLSPNVLATGPGLAPHVAGGTTSATLTLSSQAAYANLALLANTESATGTSSGTLTITFADGSTLSGVSYDDSNWTTSDANKANSTTTTGWNFGTVGAGESQAGTSDPTFTIHAGSYFLFETDINLAAMTATSGPSTGLNAATLPIASITFNAFAGSNSETDIFALSGTAATPAPEPASAALLCLGALGLLRRRRGAR